MTSDNVKVPCRVCGSPTQMRATKLCDACWELESRIHADPERAAKILAALNSPLKSGTDLRARVKQLNEAVWFLGLDDAIKIVTPYNSRGELVAHVLETVEQRANVHKPRSGCGCSDRDKCRGREDCCRLALMRAELPSENSSEAT